MILWEISRYYTRHILCQIKHVAYHYLDIIMTAIASQITILTIVYSTVYLGSDQRKHQSAASLPLCGEFSGGRWIPRTNGQQRGKCFHLLCIMHFGFTRTDMIYYMYIILFGAKYCTKSVTSIHYIPFIHIRCLKLFSTFVWDLFESFTPYWCGSIRRHWSMCILYEYTTYTTNTWPCYS